MTSLPTFIGYYWDKLIRFKALGDSSKSEIELNWLRSIETVYFIQWGNQGTTILKLGLMIYYLTLEVLLFSGSVWIQLFWNVPRAVFLWIWVHFRIWVRYPPINYQLSSLCQPQRPSDHHVKFSWRREAMFKVAFRLQAVQVKPKNRLVRSE